MADKETLQDTVDRHEDEIRSLKAAFIKDTHGDPDYAAHKVYHRDQTTKEDEDRHKRSDLLTNIWTWAIVGIMTLLASNLIQNLPKIMESVGK